MLYVGFPAYAVSVGAGAHASGYMWAAVSAGSMIGGFVLSRRAAGRSPWRLMSGCLLAMAVSALAWPLAASLSVALALIFLTGLLDGPALVALISIRQRVAPAHLRAQIFTTAASIHFAVIAAGPALAALVHEAFGTTATLLAFAALIAVAGTASLLTQSNIGEPAAEAGRTRRAGKTPAAAPPPSPR